MEKIARVSSAKGGPWFKEMKHSLVWWHGRICRQDFIQKSNTTGYLREPLPCKKYCISKVSTLPKTSTENRNESWPPVFIACTVYIPLSASWRSLMTRDKYVGCKDNWYFEELSSTTLPGPSQMASDMLSDGKIGRLIFATKATDWPTRRWKDEATVDKLGLTERQDQKHMKLTKSKPTRYENHSNLLKSLHTARSVQRHYRSRNFTPWSD